MRQATKKAKIDRLVTQWGRIVRSALRATRDELGIEQNVLADRMGWNPGLMTHLENGRRKLTVEEFIVLCQQMDTRPEDVFRRIMHW